jgi:hypothetical protein
MIRPSSLLVIGTVFSGGETTMQPDVCQSSKNGPRSLIIRQIAYIIADKLNRTVRIRTKTDGKDTT